MTTEHFTLFLIVMAAIAAIVFIALYFVEAGYGMLFDKNGDFRYRTRLLGFAWKRRFYRHVFVMERIGTTVRDSTVPDILILRTALFPTIFYFSSVDKRQK